METHENMSHFLFQSSSLSVWNCRYLSACSRSLVPRDFSLLIDHRLPCDSYLWWVDRMLVTTEHCAYVSTLVTWPSPRRRQLLATIADNSTSQDFADVETSSCRLSPNSITPTSGRGSFGEVGIVELGHYSGRYQRQLLFSALSYRQWQYCFRCK